MRQYLVWAGHAAHWAGIVLTGILLGALMCYGIFGFSFGFAIPNPFNLTGLKLITSSFGCLWLLFLVLFSDNIGRY